MPFEARVLHAPGDGFTVAGAGAAAYPFARCEISGSGRHALVVDSSALAPVATVNQCNLVGNAGHSVLNLQGAPVTLSARDNGWGDSSGAPTAGGNALSARVDAASPAPTPLSLGY